MQTEQAAADVSGFEPQIPDGKKTFQPGTFVLRHSHPPDIAAGESGFTAGDSNRISILTFSCMQTGGEWGGGSFAAQPSSMEGGHVSWTHTSWLYPRKKNGGLWATGRLTCSMDLGLFTHSVGLSGPI